MGRTRNPYLLEEWCLARASGKTAQEFAKERGIPASTLRGWCMQTAVRKQIERHRRALTIATVKAIAELSARQAVTPAVRNTVQLHQPA